MEFKDHFSRQAGLYTQFRPRYPRELFEFLAESTSSWERAWDCATGNGQAAVDLAEHYDEVIATDASATQIEHAQPHARVRYLVAAAEHSPLGECSVDLVTVAQALHWFDLDRFYPEVRRVGRVGGLLAVWAYGLAKITPEVDALVWRLYKALDSYWPPERGHIETGYVDLPFPFQAIETPRFAMSAQWSLEHLLGYLETWSSVQQYAKQHGTNAVDQIQAELTDAWGAAAEHDVSWPLLVRVGRLD